MPFFASIEHTINLNAFNKMTKIHIFAVALASLIVTSNALSQSVSIGPIKRVGPRQAVGSNYGTSFSGSAGACSNAKSGAIEWAKEQANVEAYSLDSCECSASEVPLTGGIYGMEGKYRLATGINFGEIPKAAKLHECTVTINITYNR